MPTSSRSSTSRILPRLLALLVVTPLAALGAQGPSDADPAGVGARAAPSPLLVIDQNRETVVQRIVDEWGAELGRSGAGIDGAQLRALLETLRADQLLGASMAGTLEGLRNVIAASIVGTGEVKPALLRSKTLGDADRDLVYVPVAPCRLVDTRAPYPAVYQNAGPFAPNEVRSYTLEGGNGACLSQLPASIAPSAVQIVVFGIPTTSASGDIEVLPQGTAFGNTATQVYLGNNGFTSSSATTPVNLANKQISVQVRGGGAHVAIDVLGYFRTPDNGYVRSVTAGAGLTGGTILSAGVIGVDTSVIQSRVSGTCASGSSIRAIAGNGAVTCQADTSGPANAFVQGGNAFAATAVLGSSDANALELRVNGVRAMRIDPTAATPNLVGGNQSNGVAASVNGATIGGGGDAPPYAHSVTGNHGTIAGGRKNLAYAGAAVGGGFGNVAGGAYSSVGGGTGNTASGGVSAIGGGEANVASGGYAAIAGGKQNLASGGYGVVSGGILNSAEGDYSVVLGGGDNHATGPYATIVGGALNHAQGSTSIVMGYRALTTPAAMGSFVFSDSSNGEFGSGVANEFLVGATGGIGLYTSKVYATGCKIAAGGGQWQCTSSRDAKADFAPVDVDSILDRVVALPITTWRYRTEAGSARHVGPMAQDFYRAFALGDEDTAIGVLDGTGVALAAIQGLHRQLRERDAAIAALRERIDELASALARGR